MPSFALQRTLLPGMGRTSPVLAFIDSDFSSGMDAATVPIAAIFGLLGAAIHGSREAIRWTQHAVAARRETIVFEKPRGCGLAETAGAYLVNLQRDEIDHVLRSIPPRTFEWKLPDGQTVEVRQAVGKDGLTFDVNIRDPGGKRYRLQSVRAEVTDKGIKVPAGRIPLQLGGRSLGELDVALRADPQGLNEVTLAHTGADGRVTVIKLKTRPCDPEAVGAEMMRMNVGGAKDARFLGEAHLARSARARGGNLHQGLTDLLMQIQPSANGLYRNHGSASLDLLARPLELLRKSGADLSGLHAIQRDYGQLARRPDGKPIDEKAFRALRQQAWGWLQQALRASIDQGRIDPQALANRFGVNYGLDAVRTVVVAKQAAARKRASAQPVERAYRQGEGIGTPFGQAIWAGRNATGDGLIKTRTTSYTVPAGAVDLGNRDAVRAWVLRSVERGHIRADDLYGASQARYLDGERIGTPRGDLFFDAADRSGPAQVRGRSRSYRIKQGIDLGNRDAVRAWVIRAIELKQIDRDQLLAPATAMQPVPVQDAWPVRVKARWRAVQQAVRHCGWDAKALADGRLFIWRVAGNSPEADVLRSLGGALDVPPRSFRQVPLSHNVSGKTQSGLAVSAHLLRG